ncbi:PilZ domain-containing protein [Nitrosococcus wardiae]|uniref:PilZ domain-containing protein n=1 Tax=Nitrosococcus wardiae TaxID=1814290 RepID=A0A4P7BW61_9GAMM|nr:PilZ domain-containing protein [Nitrosococcus wardiae]QBQ53439.1 PilZ domain-containing protein [Nitrosococcus wardiae]
MSCFLSKRIERRRNPRKQAAVRVYLSWSGQQPCRCRVTNLSVTGAFVEVGPLRIPEDGIIKLVFVLPAESLIKTHHLSAIVVHRSQEGIGLMFR